ncbi:MAG TPA: hypothetical protein VHW09_05090 [Bryobacteraceae bacterium]|jgi:asparagine synthetase B (glutamine-hydrolysing)|nr:hypothetical protein [Bryobacteraceae bacterium]
MCGISGHYSFDGAIDPAQAAAARRLAHRGPDDADFFADRDRRYYRSETSAGGA